MGWISGQYPLSGCQVFYFWKPAKDQNPTSSLTGYFIQVKVFSFIIHPRQFPSAMGIMVGFWYQPETSQNKEKQEK